MGTRHGMSHSPEWVVWRGIIIRCYNPQCRSYRYYGERGIKMSDEWKNSFAAFYRDMGKRPSKEMHLDRIDSNGDYCKENCRWLPRKENLRRRSNNKRVFYQGQIRILAELAELAGLSTSLVNGRLKKGDSLERALRPQERFFKHSKKRSA